MNNVDVESFCRRFRLCSRLREHLTLCTQSFRLTVPVCPGRGQPRTILTSELYNAKGSAEDGIESVKKNSVLDERYERKDSSSGKPMFNLKASNGQVIGTSGLSRLGMVALRR
ncbi:YegP family protein [Lysobacter antibioticus]|uniref:YegP family protein n=1 Tax=Lysobacter antibioticus TaxID=84531 RepID=UPI00200E0129